MLKQNPGGSRADSDSGFETVGAFPYCSDWEGHATSHALLSARRSCSGGVQKNGWTPCDEGCHS